METTRRGNKQTKQAACVPTTKVNKQTNKRWHVQGVDAGGNTVLHNLWSPLHNMSEYKEGLWRYLEKCGVQCTRLYSDRSQVAILKKIGSK